MTQTMENNAHCHIWKILDQKLYSCAYICFIWPFALRSKMNNFALSGSFSFSSKMVNSKACIVHLHILLIYLLMKPGCDAKRQNVSQIIKYRLQKIMYQPYLQKMYKMLLPPRCQKEQNCFLQLMKLLRVRIKHPGKGVRMKLRIG